VIGRLLAAALLLTATGAAAEPCRPAKGAIPEGFTVAAAGDIIYQRLALARIRADAPAVVRALSAADVTFGNFESNAFELKGFSGPLRKGGSDGPVLLTPPAAVDEIARLGFDIVSHANNHTFDFSGEGLVATGRTLDRAGLVHAGSGASLAAARAPACASVKGVQVALVAASTAFPPAAAGPGPGLNPLRLTRTERGFIMDAGDLAALTVAVETAAKTSAIVLFSLHTHDNGEDTLPPAFVVELARRMIDAGASAFIAHGPHQLRGVEIYNGRPIFHSLANFSVASPNGDLNPEPLVLPPGSIFTKPAFVENVVASWRYQGGRMSELRLTPFELVRSEDPETNGLPKAASPQVGQAIIERLAALSSRHGTDLRYENGVGVIRIKRGN
jgi:hypothetical protein